MHAAPLLRYSSLLDNWASMALLLPPRALPTRFRDQMIACLDYLCSRTTQAPRALCGNLDGNRGAARAFDKAVRSIMAGRDSAVTVHRTLPGPYHWPGHRQTSQGQQNGPCSDDGGRTTICLATPESAARVRRAMLPGILG